MVLPSEALFSLGCLVYVDYEYPVLNVFIKKAPLPALFLNQIYNNN